MPLQPRGEPLLAPRSLIRATVRSEQALDILPEAISSACTFTLSYLLSPNLLNPCKSLAPPNKGSSPTPFSCARPSYRENFRGSP